MFKIVCLFGFQFGHFQPTIGNISRAQYYDVNPLVALLGPKGVAPSNDPHISRGLLLCFNR